MDFGVEKQGMNFNELMNKFADALAGVLPTDVQIYSYWAQVDTSANVDICVYSFEGNSSRGLNSNAMLWTPIVRLTHLHVNDTDNYINSLYAVEGFTLSGVSASPINISAEVEGTVPVMQIDARYENVLI